MFTIYF
jgi:hypothetical protein